MRPDRDPASVTGSDRPEDTDPFDPVALEKRLKEAKIRRDRVLASRSPGRSEPSTARHPVKAGAPRVGRAFRVAAMFFAGAGVGAAAVLTSEPLRHWANLPLGSNSELAAGQGAERPETVVAAPVLPVPVPAEPDVRAASPDTPPSDLPPPWRIAAAGARAPASDFTPVPEVRIAARPALPSGPQASAPARPAALVPDLSAGPPARPEPPSRAASAPRAATAWTVAPPLVDAVSVYLNVPSTVPDEIARAALESLREGTSAEVFLASVAVAISRTNVRFYHDRDGAAAGRIAALLDPAADGSPAELRDFTGYDPKPLPGTVEIWFAGDAPATRPLAAAPAADAPRQAAVRRVERSAADDGGGGGGLVEAVGRSLASLLRASDSPPVSVATRGESGHAASGFRGVGAPSARSSSGGNAAPAPSSVSAPRNQASAPATRGAADVSPSRPAGAAAPASPPRSTAAGSAAPGSGSGKTGAPAAKSPGKVADGGAAGGSGGGAKSRNGADEGGKSAARGKSGQSKSAGGGKSRGADRSDSGKSKASDRSGGGKSKESKSSGGGKSGSKGGGKSGGGKGSGGKGR